MKKGLFLVLVLVLALTVVALAFQNEPDGFRGLKWGDPPGEDMKYLSKDKSNSDFLWYKKIDEFLQIGRLKLDSVSHGFYQDQFFLVSILTCIQRAGDPIAYYYLKDTLILKFGRGQRISRLNGYLDRWDGDKSTIVLEALRGRSMLTIYSTVIWFQKERDEKMKAAEEARREQEKHWTIKDLEAAQEGLGDF